MILQCSPEEMAKRNLSGSSSSEPGSKMSKTDRLQAEFFQKSVTDLAGALLGKVLVREIERGDEKIRLSARIMETEAYLGGEDKASHSYKGKKTPRNQAMFMNPGTIYVYPIYGIYECLNISSSGDGAAVLLRALEPLEGIETMKEFRSPAGSPEKKKKLKLKGHSS